MVVDKATDDAGVRPATGRLDVGGIRAREALIAETLEWCAELFRATRARFISPDDSGAWIVYTRHDDRLSTHQADYAEAAMARTVGLARQPLVVTRPRVSRVGTSDIRPISVHGYLGIPLICQDRLAGVIECAGDVHPDMEGALLSALPRLEQTGARLLHDPALRARPAVSAGDRCVLSGGVWTNGDIQLTPDEFSFLSAIVGPTTVEDAAAAVSLDIDAALALARSLIARGLIEVA